MGVENDTHVVLYCRKSIVVPTNIRSSYLLHIPQVIEFKLGPHVLHLCYNPGIFSVPFLRFVDACLFIPMVQFVLAIGFCDFLHHIFRMLASFTYFLRCYLPVVICRTFSGLSDSGGRYSLFPATAWFPFGCDTFSNDSPAW